MIKNYLCDVLLCKSSVLSLHPQTERFVVNPVRGVVDFNTNFNFYFCRFAEDSARVCEGFSPLAFNLFPHEDLVCADFAVSAFFAGEGCKIIFAFFYSFLDSIY